MALQAPFPQGPRPALWAPAAVPHAPSVAVPRVRRGQAAAVAGILCLAMGRMAKASRGFRRSSLRAGRSSELLLEAPPAVAGSRKEITSRLLDGPLEALAALLLVPLVLVAMLLLGPFTKDVESLVIRALPPKLCRFLRDVPLTWEVFSLWEFALACLAAIPKPHLALEHLREDGTVQHSYGEKHWQQLTVFGATAEERKPLVVFIHGGSWSHSRHWMYRLAGRKLEALGAAAAVVGYGQYPRSSVPDMVQDIQTAVAWLRGNAKELNIDPSRVVLLGHSSGGHLATLAAMDMKDLAGVAVLSSPMDIADHFLWEQGRGVADVSALYPAHGGEAGFAELSPTLLLQQAAGEGTRVDLPPFFVCHGHNDGTVPPSSSLRFATALESTGVDVELHIWPGLGHFSVLAELLGLTERSSALEQLEDFLRRAMQL